MNESRPDKPAAETTDDTSASPASDPASETSTPASPAPNTAPASKPAVSLPQPPKANPFAPPPIDPDEEIEEDDATPNLVEWADDMSAASPLREKVLDAIREVYDPEIPVDIYELGLIYKIGINDENDVQVIMTLTSPACPSAQELPLEVRTNVGRVVGVKDVEVDITFDPPWSPDRMSELARVKTGMF